MNTNDSPIHEALNGLVSAQRDLVTMLRVTDDRVERREEELRDAHLELGNALNRRMDALQSYVDECIATLSSRVDEIASQGSRRVREV